MKRVLLTWYGITDLRAALGFEESDGPVLSALTTGTFTDAIVLGYTAPEKSQVVDSKLMTEWLERVTTPSVAKQQVDRRAAQDAVDAFSNTQSGHELYIRWLDEVLRSRRRNVGINLIPKRLTKLNDVEGIIDAATTAIRTALSRPDQKRLTAFISPGTPVMAYVWALLARSNPHLEIEVMANSDPRTEPEVVGISSAAPLPMIYPDAECEGSDTEYELVVHLMGEQPIPVLFGVRQFSAKQHLILTTKEHEAMARRLATAWGITATPIVIPDAFKPADTRKAIGKQIAKLPLGCKIAVNTTGGTKLMFAGALSACWERGLDPFYVEIRKHNVISLRDGSQVPFVGISNVEDFLGAENFLIDTSGSQNDEIHAIRHARLVAAAAVWKHRSVMGALYKTPNFMSFNEARDRDSQRGVLREGPFSFTWANGHASLDETGRVRLELSGALIDIPAAGSYQFIAGGWLEDLTYSLLRPLEESGVIRDLRVSLRVKYPDESLSPLEATAQEFDCLFTDGKRLWIVECKAGAIRQEAIQKLENNLKLYGGVAARGIIVSTLALGRTQAARIKRSPGISVVNPELLSSDELQRIIQRV